MNTAQQKAWDCLREDEKQSLFLQISNGKSSWESGTIMKRSHYKYIEIRERSQVFFKMFTNFFTLHESIFRPDAPFSSTFMDYIEACIEKRLDRKNAALRSGDSSQIIAKIRGDMIQKNMRKLLDSDDEWDKDTKSLIIEFDRWNNFRILPRIMQAPSPFRRRVNEKHKIYLQYLLKKFPKWAHSKLIERYRYKSNRFPNKPKYWVCLISRELYPEDGYYVFSIRPDEEPIKEMSRFFLYVFKTQDDADTFGFMVTSYYDKTSSIPSGQKFWVEFRNLLEDSVNYAQVNNIDFNQKILDSAYSGVKPHKKKRKRKISKELSEGVKRGGESEFYRSNKPVP